MNQKDSFDLIVPGIRKKISPQVRAVFLSAVFFGLFCHGTGMLNKLSHHDEVATIFGMGGTVFLGRWMLQVLAWMESVFFGTGNTSLPLYNGMISLLCIGATGGLVVHLLKIRNCVYCALLGCVMAAFPTVTALFAYMYTSHTYLVGLLMMTASACLICGKTPWWGKLLAVLLGGCGTGVYQAFLPFFVSVILLSFIREIAEEEIPLPVLLRRGVSHVLYILAALLFYIAANEFFLQKYQMELSGYQGIDQMGQLTFQTLLGRIGRALGEFLHPSKGFADMYPGTLYPLYFLMLAAEGLLILRLVILLARKDRGRAVLLAALFILLPLGINLIYVMVEDEVHALMVYGQVMHVVLFVWLFDRLEFSSCGLKRAAAATASLVLAAASVMYSRYDNQCYLKDTLHQQEAISYYTTLITRIKSLPGYRPDLEIYFANAWWDPQDPTVYNAEELNFIRINPYWHDTMEYIHCPTRFSFMRVWCGADFTVHWGYDLDALPEVQAMPAYPADGSIRIMDDVVVIKFDGRTPF